MGLGNWGLGILDLEWNACRRLGGCAVPICWPVKVGFVGMLFHVII